MKRDRSRRTDGLHASSRNDDANHKNHRGKSGNSASDFSQCSLIDYLQVDPRPVLVFDVHASRHIFSNSALTSSPSLHQALLSKDNSNPDHKSFAAFFEVSITGNQNPEPVSHRQNGYSWTAVLLNKNWLVVSGVKDRDDSETPTEPSSTCDDQKLLRYGGVRHPPAPGTANPDLHRGEALPLLSCKSAHSSNDSLYRLPFSRLPPSAHLTFIRQFDWASTSLGPIETWSPYLRQACEMMIVNPDPCTIFWGDDLTMVWNEPYVAVAASKHPTFFGQPARRSWGEVWDQYDPLFNQMRVDGESFKQENVRLVINRKGYSEEGFFNLRVMPVTNDDGTVIGFYEPVIETTRQVLTGRRLETLLQISESLSSSTCIEDLWQILLNALWGHESDVFFAALYLPKPDTSNASGEVIYELRGSVGLNSSWPGFLASASTSGGNDSELETAIRQARETKSSVVLRLADGTLSEKVRRRVRDCGVEDDCRSIVISPLKSGSDASIAAMLMIGTNPKREYDDDYGMFIELLVRQFEGTLTTMELFEKERELLKQRADHQSQVRIQTFAKHTQVGIFIFDPNGAIKFCNDAWLDLCGLTREDSHVPMSWVDTVHPENAPEIVKYWERISNLEGPQTFEVQYKKPWQPKGSNMSLDRTYVIASAYPEISESGELTGILGCVTDISHVKWAEKIQSQRLEEALELKRQQENFVDITSHEMRNPLNAILHCASELVENLTTLTTDSPSTKSRITTLKESLDAASTIQYCGKHQKRIIDDVLTVSKLDSDLLTVAPLSSRPPQIVRQVLSVFETEIRASMIEAEMEISKSYHELAIDAVLIDPHRVIQIIINLLSNSIKFLSGEGRRNVKVVIGASKQEPADTAGGVRYVPSGRHRKDPTTETEWGNGEALFLTFSIRDSGIGMTQEVANSLFHRFTQASPRTHVQYGGSGLGLFISRELSELHGGRIGLSSQLGSGSTFAFYVKGRRDTAPVEKASNPGTSPPPQHMPHAIVARLRDSVMTSEMPALKEMKSSPTVMQQKHTDILRVLIVEDNLVNQQILKKLMHKQGYQTSIANHGQEALDIISSSQWCVNAATNALQLDVVLCDVEMPVMGGKETVARVREMQYSGTLLPHIPVIAVTGNARPEQIRSALDAGFDDVVAKPYEVSDLLERVRKFTTR